jgi:GMP synthase-like glutamine amidotransferase
MAMLILHHSRLVGADRLAEKLRDHGQQLRFVNLHAGDPVPDDLIDVDGIVTCGGAGNVNDDAHPWLEQEMALLRAAHEAELPVIGLCLGSQIMTRAFGGEVAPLDGGIELGWHPVRLTPIGREDPLYAGAPWTSMQAHWHRYYASKTPPGAKVLAKSDRCPVQAWSLGVRTYAFQYHPEIRSQRLEEWHADDPKDLEEAGMTIDALRQQTKQHYPSFERVTDRFFERIVLLLAAPDRRTAGVVKDLHH